jgi:hypothetical protein
MGLLFLNFMTFLWGVREAGSERLGTSPYGCKPGESSSSSNIYMLTANCVFNARISR